MIIFGSYKCIKCRGFKYIDGKYCDFCRGQGWTRRCGEPTTGIDRFLQVGWDAIDRFMCKLFGFKKSPWH